MMNLKIGSTVYLINKKSLKEKVNGTRISIAKVATFKVSGGKVVPELIATRGAKSEYDHKLYHVFSKQEEAIEKLKGK